MSRCDSDLLAPLGSAVYKSADVLIVDGYAALELICLDWGLDAANKEHQHEALAELQSILDTANSEAIVVWG